MKLTGYIPDNKDYKLYFDNYFKYIELSIELKSKNIWAAGTLHGNRMGGCILKLGQRIEDLKMVNFILIIILNILNYQLNLNRKIFGLQEHYMAIAWAVVY